MKAEKIIFLDFDGPLCVWGDEERDPSCSESKAKIKFNTENSIEIPEDFTKDLYGGHYFKRKTAHPLWEVPVSNLNTILRETDADIVISSTWRQVFSFSQLCFIMDHFGIIKQPIDITPSFWYEGRGREIDRWFANNDFKGNFCIIDDMSIEMLEPFTSDNHIWTKWKTGIDKEDVEKAIGILNRSK